MERYEGIGQILVSTSHGQSGRAIVITDAQPEVERGLNCPDACSGQLLQLFRCLNGISRQSSRGG